MKIQNKASLIMAAFGVVIVVLLSVGYDALSRQTILNKELHNLKNVTDEMALHFDSHLKGLVSASVTLSSAPVISSALQKRNQELAALPDEERNAVINNRDQQWRKTRDTNDPFIQAYMTKPVAKFLKAQQKLFPQRYGEIFLTNRFGEMIATTGKLTTLAHSHKYWWQASYDDGRGRVFLDDRGFDTSVEGYVLGVVVPIKDDNEIIGILKANVNIIGPLSDVVNEFALRHTGKLQVVRTGGLVISEQDVTPLSKQIDDVFVKLLKGKKDGALTVDTHKETLLVAFSSIVMSMGSEAVGFGGKGESIDHIKGNKGEGWHIIISRDKQSVLEASRNVTLIIIVVGVIFTLLSTVIALLLARRIAGPIVELADSAEAIGMGNLDVRNVVHSDDEIGLLAKSLNTTVENLQKTLVSRDKLSTEIEQRKKVEKLLSQFKTTLDQTQDCIFIFNPETLRFSYVNQGAVNQVGYNTDELKKMTPLDIKPEFDEPSFRAMAESIVHSDSKQSVFETVHQHKNGSLIPVEVSMQYIALEKENRFITVVRDITERKEAAEKLRKLNQELEERVKQRTTELTIAKETAEIANRAKGIFIANMSHQFRTPLNAVLGFSQLMMDDEAISDKHREYLRNINRSGHLQLTLVNDVLAMSSLEDRQTTVKPQVMDFTKLLDDISNKATLDAKEKGIGFTAEYGPDIPQYISCDHEKLQQIVGHVTDNAIKYTESGGVSLKVKSERMDNSDTVQLVIDIADTGIGIPQEDQKRIFLPFVQLEEQSDKTGTGLGLTLAQRYLKLMSGMIDVNSEADRGTVFQITLPVTLATAVELEPSKLRKPDIISIVPNGKEYRVLVVDNDKINRVLLTKILESVDFPVRAASNGKQAIEIFKAWQPHLIWMDMHMPEMDGSEATAKIRQLPGGDTVKIVAITTGVFKAQEKHILETGCNAVVHKPFDPDGIFDTMAKQLEVRYLYQETARPEEEVITLTAEMLAELPTDLKEALREQAVLLDLAATNEIIERLRSNNPKIANGLQQLVNELRFGQILSLLDDTKKRDV